VAADKTPGTSTDRGKFGLGDLGDSVYCYFASRPDLRAGALIKIPSFGQYSSTSDTCKPFVGGASVQRTGDALRILVQRLYLEGEKQKCDKPIQLLLSKHFPREKTTRDKIATNGSSQKKTLIRSSPRPLPEDNREHP